MGIIFDFDGTLVGGMSMWIRALKHTLLHFSVYATSSELENEFRRLHNDGTSGSPWRKVFRRRVPGREDEAWSLFFEMLEQEMKNVSLSTSFRRSLKTLRSRGVKTGIVTFRNHESVQNMLARMNASRIFDTIIGTGDTSEEKPSPQPFLFAAEMMKVKPEECLVIGDEPADIIGGNRAGMRTIGVLGGVSDQQMLVNAGANRVMGSIEELEISINMT